MFNEKLSLCIVPNKLYVEKPHLFSNNIIDLNLIIINHRGHRDPYMA